MEYCGPPSCPEGSSNCYECGDEFIPIWFPCDEGPPIINPIGGPELVCYEYNTNDPIYYNPGLNQGAAVVVEHDNPVAGGSYSYGQVATLCSIPDEFQLCVYLVTSGGVATKLTYLDDFTINNELATVSLNNTVDVNGAAKIRFARCTDDKKMFLTFTEGAKLSADDINASMHQLLFLIQEKEFASNTYYQLQNAIGLGASVQWDFDSATAVAATSTNAITVTGTPVNGQTLTVTDTLQISTVVTADSSLSAGVASADKFSTVGTTVEVATALRGALNNAAANITAAEGGTTSKISLTQDIVGAAGNTDVQSTLSNVDILNSGVADAAFSGGIDFVAGDIDGFYFQLTSYDSATATTVRKYRFDDAGVIATGEYINVDEVCIQFNGISSWSLLILQIEAAIAAAKGHTSSKLVTKRFTTDTLNDSLQVTQKVVGPGGNTAIPYSHELNSIMVTPTWEFTGGLDYDTTQPAITFDPPISLPINFSLAGMTADSVLTWNGNGSFVGRTPAGVVNKVPIDGLSNVQFGTVNDKNMIMFDYNSQTWENKDFATEVAAVSDTVDLRDWLNYNSTVNGDLDDYYSSSFDTAVDTAWTGVSGVASIPKNHIPNAITSFGMGYYAAEKQIADQVANGSSALNARIAAALQSSTASGGTITSSFRWEISRGEGRGLDNLPKRPYYDVRDFDSLNFSNSASSHTGIAYRLAVGSDPGAAFCTSCRNKLFKTNIDAFVFSGTKSTTFGLGPHKEVGTDPSIPQSMPVSDRYLTRIRSILTLEDWGSALGYTEQHPLYDYPADTGTSGAYLDFLNSDNFIRADYRYSTISKTQTEGSGDDTVIYNSTKNLPTVVTYAMGQLWGNTADHNGNLPANTVWSKGLDQAGNLAKWTDYGFTGTDNPGGGIPNSLDAPEYLGSTGNYYFYHRWWVTGYDSTESGTLANFTDITYYNPHEPSKLLLNTNDKYTILPYKQGSEPGAADAKAAQKTGYSYLVEANRAFSNLEKVLPDQYDEFVFAVTLSEDARQLATTQCPDANCYEVNAMIERYIDGCYAAEGNCTNMGSGSTNSAGEGYHIYPDDFDDDVLRAWDTYPFEKLGIEIRNKTGTGFDLVLQCPRLKRIGMLDVFTDASNGSSAVDYHQLSFDFLTEYAAGNFDGGAGVTDPHGTQVVNDITISDMVANNVAAFTVETAVQFIRLGIPTCIRVAFSTVATPQTKVFAD
jgi:hypothetical protein